MKLRIVGFLLVAVPEPPEDDDELELEDVEAVELAPDVPLLPDLLVLEPLEVEPPLAVAEDELLVVVVGVVVWEEVD